MFKGCENMYILRFRIVGGYDNILQFYNKDEAIQMKALLTTMYSLTYITIFKI